MSHSASKHSARCNAAKRRALPPGSVSIRLRIVTCATISSCTVDSPPVTTAHRATQRVSPLRFALKRLRCCSIRRSSPVRLSAGDGGGSTSCCASSPARARVLGLLLGASLLFYGWWNPLYLPLLGGIAVFNFHRRAMDHRAARWSGRADRVRLLLIFGIVGRRAGARLFQIHRFPDRYRQHRYSQTDFMLQHILLPLGISFFTFQKIAYLVDCSPRRGRRARLSRILLLRDVLPAAAGRPDHPPQRDLFARSRAPGRSPIKPSNFMLGLTIFVIGLFKKVVLADDFAPSVASVLRCRRRRRDRSTSSLAWQGAIAFKFQLYFDFSGVFRDGARRRAPVRHPAAAQFQLALPGTQRRRLSGGAGA